MGPASEASLAHRSSLGHAPPGGESKLKLCYGALDAATGALEAHKTNLHRLHTTRLRMQHTNHDMAHLNVSGSNC